MSGGIAALPRRIGLEFTGLTLTGPRARLALAAALAVGIATILALWLHLEAPFWAGISAFICMQASQPKSLQKGLHRILGTLTGAAAAFFLFRWTAYNQAATMLLLFSAGTLAILGSMVSNYSYAWLLGGITAMMVVLGAINDPNLILNLAVYRGLEIMLGTSVALITAQLMLPHEAGPVTPAPGWASLLGRNRHMVHHAMHTGLAAAFIPVIWRVFALPDITQMAISIGAVMAVPVLTGNAAEDNHAIAERSAQRLLGCLLGGGFGLLFITTPLATVFPVWLLVLMAGAAIGDEFETGRQGISVVGIQAVVALILTVTQGWGPPISLAPAIDRIAGISGAVTLLFVINFLFAPPLQAEAVSPA